MPRPLSCRLVPFAVTLAHRPCRRCETDHYWLRICANADQPGNEALRHPLQHQPIESCGERCGILRQFTVKDLRLFEQQ